MKNFTILINGNVHVQDAGDGLYPISVNGKNIGTMQKIDDAWIIQEDHNFTDVDLQLISAEIQKQFGNP
jgi:hypothetical protein